MAAKAYASLVSLLNTMDQIQTHPRLSTCFDNYPKESLREKVDSFLNFVENYSDEDSKEAEDLVRQIAAVAHEAEDLIEVQAAHVSRARFNRKRLMNGDGSTEKNPSFLPDLQKIIEDMDSIEGKVMKVQNEIGLINRQPTYFMPPPSSSLPPIATKKAAMVGFDSYLAQLLDELTGDHSGRRILPIVGMGGIGKTTLARNVYENSLIVHHFDVRAWVTVSQEFRECEILFQALSSLGRITSKMDRTDYDQLGEELHKVLYDRRYLIILDDVWSVEAWEKIKKFIPGNKNRSRIVITTRQSEVVDYFGSSALVVEFLDEKNSWELFCEKTFAQEGCPPELEQVGKKIVKKCKGLPLGIILVGGLLGKSPRTQQYWDKFSNNKSLILDLGEGNKPLSILYLSYKHLPIWLKSCFLYLGVFPEDHKIDVSELINLWVAEGYIRSKIEQSLEEVTESYVKDLIGRNLLLVSSWSEYKKLETCRVHDLIRDLCIGIAEKEKFYCIQRDIDGKCRFIFDEGTARFYHRQYRTSQTPSLRKPLILEGQRVAPCKSRLLRVLFRNERCNPPQNTFQQVNLRFLCLGQLDHNQLPSSISLLWSLQTLVIDAAVGFVVPSEIWKMPQLRHIKMFPLYLPNPPPSGEQDAIIILQNLQTLESVHNLNLIEDVCKRIPNIKKLNLTYDAGLPCWKSLCYDMQNVGCLNKLESLYYCCQKLRDQGYSLQNPKLPSSLKELTIELCCLDPSVMAMIGSLPHLECLDLESCTVVEPEWNCVEEEFHCLKHLRINSCKDLIYWFADSSNFPVLETLDIRFLYQLEEIPSSIGKILTLETMDVIDCSESATMSAVKILQEQNSLGNLGLQLRLMFPNETEAEIWSEKLEEELGFTSQNLHISFIE